MGLHHDRSFLFTSESVTEGHPDKVCDQISDAILDAILAKEARLEGEGYISPTGVPACVDNVRCACETFVTTGTVVVAGEIRTQAYVDVQTIARDVLRRIGYDRAKYGFDCETCGVINMIHEQSPDIARGVDGVGREDGDPLDLIGAGDQGMMFGYASDETAALMPMPIYLAQRMAQRLALVRKSGEVPYLRPDGKTQVTVRYEDDEPVEVTAVVVSTQHDPVIEDMNIVLKDMVAHVIAPVLDEVGIAWDNATIYVNPTGRFVVGGPMGDTGLTGRKIVVDTYGGMGRHGGGAFSGKDCTKVDRSAAYAARWVAKNVVAAGLARRCEVQLAYAIGVAKPVSIFVDTYKSAHVSAPAGSGISEEGGEATDAYIASVIGSLFDLTPAAIVKRFGLKAPIYGPTAAYGHMGRKPYVEDGLQFFGWEKLDAVPVLKEKFGL